MVDLLRVPALQMSYEWQRRSDCRQSYETALHFAFNILHLYMEEHAELEAAAAASEGAVLQATHTHIHTQTRTHTHAHTHTHTHTYMGNARHKDCLHTHAYRQRATQ